VIIDGHGLSIDVPAGWEGRIFRRGGGGPIVHVASFALHPGDGDFGAAATGRMHPGDRFLAVLEYLATGPLTPGHGLFAPARPPAPAWAHFSPRQLQVTRTGYLGWQRFFTEAGRPLCAYAVIRPAGSSGPHLAGEIARVLSTLRVSKPAPADPTKPAP
jgi:hypothetical protein